jgi:hypothetical protein
MMGRRLTLALPPATMRLLATPTPVTAQARVKAESDTPRRRGTAMPRSRGLRRRSRLGLLRLLAASSAARLRRTCHSHSGHIAFAVIFRRHSCRQCFFCTSARVQARAGHELYILVSEGARPKSHRTLSRNVGRPCVCRCLTVLSSHAQQRCTE